MAVITNYATLQTAVADYLARSDLTAYIPNFIQNAENKLYRTLNLRNEETALSVSITSGVAAVPSDFKALKFAYYDHSPVQLLQWMGVSSLYERFPVRSVATTPTAIAREGSNFIFGAAAADGTLKGIYYAKQGFARDIDTTWYVTDAPDVLLYAALLEAAPFIKDDARLPIWQGFFNEAVLGLKEEERNSSVSKDNLSVTAF